METTDNTGMYENGASPKINRKVFSQVKKYTQENVVWDRGPLENRWGRCTV